MLNNKNLVLGTLASDAFIMVNKKLAKSIGTLEAVLLCELVARYKYWADKRHYQLIDNEYFYVTISDMWDNTGISPDQQNRIVSKLIELKLINKKLIGLPAKRHFSLNFENIAQLLYDDEVEPPNLDAEELDNKLPESTETRSSESQNNKNNNNKNNENILSKDNKKPLKQVNKQNHKTKFQKLASIIHSEFDDNEVKDALYSYLQFRISRGLTEDQWRSILANLRAIAPTKEIALECIGNSYRNSWNSFFAINGKVNNKTKNPEQDQVITTVVNTTKQELCTDKYY